MKFIHVFFVLLALFVMAALANLYYSNHELLNAQPILPGPSPAQGGGGVPRVFARAARAFGRAGGLRFPRRLPFPFRLAGPPHPGRHVGPWRGRPPPPM